MMKVAIPYWQGRVSPVFDVAGSALIVAFDAGGKQTRQELSFGDVEMPERVARLVQADVNALICGAISRPLELFVSAMGIEVISQVCGDVEQVLAAFANGRLTRSGFGMPGCRGQRRRCRAGRRRGV